MVFRLALRIQRITANSGFICKLKFIEGIKNSIEPVVAKIISLAGLKKGEKK